MPKDWKGKQPMIDPCDRENEEQRRFLGVWEERWSARARLAGQAERYRIWLREQGYSRDQAAEMAVRVLTRSEQTPPLPHRSNAPLLH